MKLFELEPQYCSDPDCDGEITWDETNKKYVCMTCDKPALNEDFREEIKPQFRIGKMVRGNTLKRGMKLAAFYNAVNEGVDYIEVLGFTGNDQKYGEGGVKYNSAKHMLQANSVKTLKHLETKDNTREYGYHHYMVAKDLEEGNEGPWYYLYNGRWSRGSGAEALSFKELGFNRVE